MAVSGMYPHVAHGESLAILYPACTRFTMNHAVKEYAFMARILNPDLESVSDVEAAGKAYEEMIELVTEAYKQ